MIFFPNDMTSNDLSCNVFRNNVLSLNMFLELKGKNHCY